MNDYSKITNESALDNLTHDYTTSKMVTYAESHFGVFDYIMFTIFISFSLSIGFFFYKRGQKTTNDYFLGNRSLNPIPVGLSTGVSFLSATILIGMPAEIYIYGYSYIIASIFGTLGFFAASMMMARVLFPLGITSLNDYFLQRFKSPYVAILARFLGLLCIFHYMGQCMMGSIIAFSSSTGGQVTPIAALAIGCSVAVIYTALGGLRAVVWTDTLQTVLMACGMLSVIIKPVIDTDGGFGEICRLNWKHGHVHTLDLSADMTVRHSFWGISVANFITWSVWAAQPANIQRMCSVSSLKDAYVVAAVSGTLFLLFSTLPGLAGFNIFGYYASRGCDVFAAGWIKRNEIVLYYVRERLNIPGFQGLFMAALFAGSLSSLSSALNAATAIVWNETIKPKLSTAVTETRALLFSKLIIVILGILGMLWTLVLHSFGGMILTVASAIDSPTFGTYFTLAFVAILFRFVNYKGLMVGACIGFVITFWLGIGQLMSGSSAINSKGYTLENCQYVNKSYPLNTTQSITDEPLIFYRISYLWLTPICLSVIVTISLVISLLDPLRQIIQKLRKRFRGNQTSKTNKPTEQGLETNMANQHEPLDAEEQMMISETKDTEIEKQV